MKRRRVVKAMTGKKLGYRRVSTIEQNAARQLDGMQLDKIFTEHASGSTTNRPQLQALIEFAREGDIVYVHSLDRLARNLADLLALVKRFTAKGVELAFVKESLTFSSEHSPMHSMLLGVMGALAQFERELILERQREGIAIAKREGKYRGRQNKLSKAQIKELRAAAKKSADTPRWGYRQSKADLARQFGISLRSVYNYLT